MTITNMQFLSQYQYDHYEQDGNQVVVYTNGKASLKIDVCSDTVYRTWMNKNGVFQKKSSFAVLNEQWSGTEYKVDEQDNALLISTDKLILEIQKRPIKLTYKDKEHKNILLTEYENKGMGFSEDGKICAYYKMGEQEHFYGLGEDNDAYEGKMDRRGSSRDLITGQTINKGCVTADIPIPFFLSTGNDGQGYGMFVDNTYHMEFNMGKESNDYYYWKAAGGECVVYFIYGPEFKKIIDRYTELTGRPSMLPLWTMGYIQSKCTYYSWEEIDDVVSNLKTKGFPLDCIVIDADWPEYLNNFKWHPRWKNMSKEKMQKYHKEGIHFMISNSGPMIKKDSTNYQSALDNGLLALDAKGNTLICGYYGGDLMDFTAPKMKDWLKEQLIPLMEEGIDGWWLDLTEPEGEPVETTYKGGSREEIHNVVANLMNEIFYQCTKEYKPNSRPFVLNRTGVAGIQRFGNAIWTGDVYSDYKTFSAHCPEALNTGLSGIAQWTCDTGGFISSTYDNTDGTNIQLYNNDYASHGLLFERWFQFSCFTPITRTHHVGPSSPFHFGKLVEESCKHYINLRYQLLPYIYTYLWKAHNTGLSIMRALVLEYQSDENVYNVKDEYMFGENLLVAPVMTEKITEREVYFPEGRWIDYDFGYEYEGGSTYTVYAPQNRIPLFVKSGAIIPMVTERRSTYDTPWSPIIFDIYPDRETSFVMYQDDGETTAFETDGIYTETTIVCKETKGENILVDITRSNHHFVPETYEFKIHINYLPEEVVCAGEKLNRYYQISSLQDAEQGFYWELLTKTLQIKIKCSGGTSDSINVTLGNKELKKVKPSKDMSIEDSQRPYFLPAAIVPCRIPAENYDIGGEGISYHVNHTGNEDNIYRKDDVFVKLCEDTNGGYAVYDLTQGEWVEYTIGVTKNLTAKNLYNFILRVSSVVEDSIVHIEIDNDNKTKGITIPNTKAEQEWETVSANNIILNDGDHILKFYVEQGKVNVNFIEIEIA